VPRPPDARKPRRPTFQSSDFHGATPEDRTALTESLNKLEEQVEQTRNLLVDVDSARAQDTPAPAPAQDRPASPGDSSADRDPRASSTKARM